MARARLPAILTVIAVSAAVVASASVARRAPLVLGPPRPAVGPGGVAPIPPEYDGDWAVGCDNVLQCEATALPSADGGDAEGSVLLQIVRAGGPAGGVAVRVRGFAALPAQVVLVADGRTIALLTGRNGGDEVSIDGDGALVAVQAMAAATMIELREGTRRGRAGDVIAAPSTKGLSDALRYMDGRQGRTGSVTALVALGTLAVDQVRPPPALPVVPQVPPPDGDGTVALSETELTDARRLAVCDPSLQATRVEELVPLSDRAALLLLPCEAGDDNVSAVPLVATGPPGRRVLAIARFDYAPGFTGEPGKPPLVVNPLWDARRGILSSLAKGRGAGDCGASEDYVWDGALFRLVESRAMHVCRGAWEWIRLWTAMPVFRMAP